MFISFIQNVRTFKYCFEGYLWSFIVMKLYCICTSFGQDYHVLYVLTLTSVIMIELYHLRVYFNPVMCVCIILICFCHAQLCTNDYFTPNYYSVKGNYFYVSSGLHFSGSSQKVYFDPLFWMSGCFRMFFTSTKIM